MLGLVGTPLFSYVSAQQLCKHIDPGYGMYFCSAVFARKLNYKVTFKSNYLFASKIGCEKFMLHCRIYII